MPSPCHLCQGPAEEGHRCSLWLVVLGRLGEFGRVFWPKDIQVFYAQPHETAGDVAKRWLAGQKDPAGTWSIEVFALALRGTFEIKRTYEIAPAGGPPR